MATTTTKEAPKTNGSGSTGAKTGTELQKSETSVSERFTVAVMKEFGTAVGATKELSEYQKRLAQHLYIKIDATLADLEKKRQETDKEGVPIIWQNVNMQKLAVDAMHRVELGLDALIPNHIWPIPYLNKRTKKYDVDLRVGYIGKDYYRRQMALDPPDDIIYELVREKDKLTVMKKSYQNPVESYDFQLPDNPFDRGEVVGGFAYLMYYKTPEKNKLIIVTGKDFKKSEGAAKSKDFWTKHADEMKYKTLVHRATDKLQIDPRKVNAAYHAVEHAEDIADAAIVEAEIAEKANTGEVIELEAESVGTAQEAGEPIPTHEEESGSGAPAEEPKAQTQMRGPGF